MGASALARCRGAVGRAVAGLAGSCSPTTRRPVPGCCGRAQPPWGGGVQAGAAAGLVLAAGSCRGPAITQAGQERLFLLLLSMKK